MVDVTRVGDLTSNVNWSAALQDMDVVIHSAARSHIMIDTSSNPLTEFRRVNVEGTLNFAKQAAVAGVKRFIFISSVKVNGELTQPGTPFTENDLCAPQDPYGISKYEAEQGLKKIAQETGMEVVIIRPPLVYGPGVKGNFQSMLQWVNKGVPLPLGAIDNQRSLVGLDNLVHFIITCIDHPAAANQTFLVSDGEDISTTELLRRVGTVLGKPARLIPVPRSVLELGAKILGKQAVAQRLLGSLQVDIGKARNLLEWSPPVTIDEGLTRCVSGFALNQIYRENKFIRLFDILFSMIGLTFGLPFFLLIIVIGFFDTGSPIFRQERVGRDRNPFVLVKFRTMKRDTASVASHLASSSAITGFGHFLRRTKVDELPQLWNVLKGEMSLVGPRPCLFNQDELIRERSERGVYTARPGITGLAQLNNIDMSTPKLLAETDLKMLQTLSLNKYLRYICLTALGQGKGDGVRADD